MSRWDKLKSFLLERNYLKFFVKLDENFKYEIGFGKPSLVRKKIYLHRRCKTTICQCHWVTILKRAEQVYLQVWKVLMHFSNKGNICLRLLKEDKKVWNVLFGSWGAWTDTYWTSTLRTKVLFGLRQAEILVCRVKNCISLLLGTRMETHKMVSNNWVWLVKWCSSDLSPLLTFPGGIWIFLFIWTRGSVYTVARRAGWSICHQFLFCVLQLVILQNFQFFCVIRQDFRTNESFKTNLQEVLRFRPPWIHLQALRQNWFVCCLFCKKEIYIKQAQTWTGVIELWSLWKIAWLTETAVQRSVRKFAVSRSWERTGEGGQILPRSHFFFLILPINYLSSHDDTDHSLFSPLFYVICGFKSLHAQGSIAGNKFFDQRNWKGSSRDIVFAGNQAKVLDDADDDDLPVTTRPCKYWYTLCVENNAVVYANITP